MGLLVNGKWQDRWYDTQASGGAFVRDQASYRNWVTVSGEPGPSGEGGFAAQPGRYHLYVSLACPWAHRALIMRKLKGLEDMISLSVVNPYMGEHGWTFEAGKGVIPDLVDGTRYMYQVYLRAQPDYSGRVTVPVLWDKQRNIIVNNESADILRMLGSAFDKVGALPGNYSPESRMQEIDSVNAMVYDTVNNGVYKAGFATEQAVYEQAVTKLFNALNHLEQRLSTQRYLLGADITEADWRLFTTLIRFDAVYHGHFKCNLRRLVDYPNLWAYTRELYQQPGIADTVNFDHIKQHYYRSHHTINPNGIVPAGPNLNLNEPHGRDRLTP
jgi:putative glutathione S-transferase